MADIPENIEKLTRELNVYITDTPELFSLLYDIDLLPEQVIGEPGSLDWRRCYMIAEAWRRMASNERVVGCDEG